MPTTNDHDILERRLDVKRVLTKMPRSKQEEATLRGSGQHQGTEELAEADKAFFAITQS